ncbi:MAG TPA: hypothetical protein VL147_08740 [Devosia sp.]|nr:hypothetical protein [Devosia sp.]
MVVGNLTFSGVEMAELYRAPGYPLQRKAPLANAGHTSLRKQAAQRLKQLNRSIPNQGVGFAI